MIEKILLDNRHKFVYFDEGSRDVFKKECLEYIFDINKSLPIYIKDDGLPKIDSKVKIEKTRVSIICERYYDFLVCLSVVDALINNIDKDILNKKFKRLFDMYSDMSLKKINNIDDLRSVLEHDKNCFVDLYKEYMSTGKVDKYNEMFMGYIVIEIFLKNIKRGIGLKGCFSIVFDYDELSIESKLNINKFINCRSNGYLSINVLCGDRNWDLYIDRDGHYIDNIHDYYNLYYRPASSRFVYKMKKGY